MYRALIWNIYHARLRQAEMKVSNLRHIQTSTRISIWGRTSWALRILTSHSQQANWVIHWVWVCLNGECKVPKNLWFLWAVSPHFLHSLLHKFMEFLLFFMLLSIAGSSCHRLMVGWDCSTVFYYSHRHFLSIWFMSLLCYCVQFSFTYDHHVPFCYLCFSKGFIGFYASIYKYQRHLKNGFNTTYKQISLSKMMLGASLTII